MKTNLIPGSPDEAVSAYDYTVKSIAQRSGVAFSGTTFSGAASISWGYNSAGEVTSADHSTTNTLDRAYQYDPIGNREKSADSLTLPGSANYTSNNLNQYTAANGSGLTYDDDGNMLTDGGNNSTAVPHSYVRDGELSPLARGRNGQSARVDCPKGGRAVRPLRRQNRLITVKQTSNSAVLVSYGYDALSRRITRTVGSTRTYYFYNGWNVIAEFSGAVHTSGTAPAVTHDLTHLWGLDLSGSGQGAGGVRGLLATERKTGASTGVYYPTYDGNGNVSEYLNASGTPVSHYEDDPFGRTTVSTGANAALFPIKFSTKPLNAVSELYYYGYRFLSPELGRWINRDPIAEHGGINITSFVNNYTPSAFDILGFVNADRVYSDTGVWEALGLGRMSVAFSESMYTRCGGCDYFGSANGLAEKKDKFTDTFKTCLACECAGIVKVLVCMTSEFKKPVGGKKGAQFIENPVLSCGGSYWGGNMGAVWSAAARWNQFADENPDTKGRKPSIIVP